MYPLLAKILNHLSISFSKQFRNLFQLANQFSCTLMIDTTVPGWWEMYALQSAHCLWEFISCCENGWQLHHIFFMLAFNVSSPTPQLLHAPHDRSAPWSRCPPVWETMVQVMSLHHALVYIKCPYIHERPNCSHAVYGPVLHS